MKLFYSAGACSLVSHIVLEESGADYEAHRVDFGAGDQLKPEFLRINPAGRVPALVTDRGVLTENAAIVDFVARTYPAAGLQFVGDEFACAGVQAFNLFIATTIHVSFRQISRPEVYADGAEAAASLRAKVPEMADRYFGLIEAQLADGRTWVHGDRFTTSDAYLFVFASYLQMGDRGDASRLPHVEAHRARVRQRPAVQRALVEEGLGLGWMADSARAQAL